MERQPRTRSARSLDRAVLARAFGFLGPVEAVASLANAFECRSSRMSPRTLGLATNRLLVAAVAVEGLALLGFVYLGPVRALLGHQPLTLAQWLPVLAAPVLLFAAEEARKAVVRQHRADRPRASRPEDPEAPDRPRLALADEDAGSR